MLARCLVILSFGVCGCGSMVYTNVFIPTPVMLGPIDRIGGKPTQSSGPTTIDAVMYTDRGWSTGADTLALSNAVRASLLAEGIGPKQVGDATVRIDEIAAGEYLMWTIPYLTPIVLIRHSRVNPHGRLQRETAQVSQ